MTINSKCVPNYFPEETTKINQRWPIHESQNAFAIEQITIPSLTNLPVHESEKKEDCSKEIELLQNTLKKLIELHKLNALDEIYQKTASLQYTSLPQDKKDALVATHAILKELTQEAYSQHAVHEYASWALRLLVNHFENGAVLENTKIEKLCSNLFTSQNLSIHPRGEEESNNPSFLLKNIKENQTPAILKIAKSPMEASHSRVIENFPLYQVQTREIIGYESDAILGFNRAPKTIKSLIKNEKSEEKIATIQEYLPKLKSIADLYDRPKAGMLLKGIDTGEVHLKAISSLIKGLAAEHINNCALGDDGRLYEVDLKECFIPFNKMPEKMKVLRRNVEDLDAHKESLEKELITLSNLDAESKIILKKTKELEILTKRLATERKTIILARVSILGLPQCDRPFDKATLMALCHPSLQPLMEAHHKNVIHKKYAFDTSALQAQLERLIQLQKLAQKELEETTISLTPRKAFFALFGGSELYDLGIKKGYHPLQIFNNIVGSAYRHEFEDLSQPETMKGRDNTKPANESETAKIIFENMQTLYSK